jgi:AcrR family transcriptional regulator
MSAAATRAIPDPSPATAGERSRRQLLEAAGEIFAERGYGQTTSKEICERAGMNSASVNYYFGGFELLYSEILAHAHRKLVAIEQLREIAASAASPRRKLRAYVALIVRRLALPGQSWEMRVVSREIISPSPAREAFVKAEILPKVAVLRDIIGACIGASPDEAIVGRSLLTVIAPGLILAIAHRDMITHVVPELGNVSDDIELLIDHIERFIHGGLEAVGAQLRAERATLKRSAPPPGRRTGAAPTSKKPRRRAAGRASS